MRRTMIILLATTSLISLAGPKAWAQTAAASQDYVVVPAPRNYVAITVPPQGSAPFAATPGDFLTGGFSVVLVIGNLQTGSGMGDVPPAAAKALADLKDFLPYKSYRLLDTAWLTGANRAISHLRGVDGRDYDLVLEARQTAPTTVAVSRFTIAPVPARQTDGSSLDAPDARGLASARAAYAELVSRNRATAERAAAERDQARTTPPVMPPGQAVIDTSFNMRIGETIVVGTSRLRGDSALIVLLTAVGKK